MHIEYNFHQIKDAFFIVNPGFNIKFIKIIKKILHMNHKFLWNEKIKNNLNKYQFGPITKKVS